MNPGEQTEQPSNRDMKRHKAELESALQKEKRISRRQVLLKKLWKLKRREAERKQEAASSAG